MKYKIGDRVRIKEDAWEIKNPQIRFADPMRNFCGSEYVVRKITEDECYKLEDVRSEIEFINQDGYWKWVEDWVEDPVGKPLDLKDFEEEELVSLFK